jgi:hypothetical protein
MAPISLSRPVHRRAFRASYGFAKATNRYRVNGATMAAHLLLTHPSLLRGAILVQLLPPYSHDLATRLDRQAAVDHRW